MLGLIIWLAILSVICILETTIIVIYICKKKKQDDNHYIDLKFCEIESSIKNTNKELEDLKSAIARLSSRK
jgi:cell division protein FtsL